MGGGVALRQAALGRHRPDAVVCVSAVSRWYVRDTKPMRRGHWLLGTTGGPGRGAPGGGGGGGPGAGLPGGAAAPRRAVADAAAVPAAGGPPHRAHPAAARARRPRRVLP